MPPSSGAELLVPTTEIGVMLRLCLALVVGGLVGWERERKSKPAGLRTHMLVSLGSAIFVLAGLQTGAVAITADVLSRVIQGVTTGIGFIGAGEIFQQSKDSEPNQIRIRGLTTASAIWVSASLGVTSACGLWTISLMGALLTLIVLKLFKRFE